MTRADAATKRAVTAAEDLSASLVKVVNAVASEVSILDFQSACLQQSAVKTANLQAFERQQQIGTKIEKVFQLTKKVTAQDEEWAGLCNSADQALRVLGDFEGFFAVLQSDMSKLADSLEQLSQQQASKT